MPVPTPPCPLCAEPRSFTLRQFAVDPLAREWTATFGFDPFASLATPPSTLTLHRCVACELEFWQPAAMGDDRFYARLSTAPWYYEDTRWEFTEALGRLAAARSIRSVLEVGCGAGHFLDKISGVYAATGLETNHAGLEACRARGHHVTDAPLAELQGPFDAVVLFEVLEHIPDPAPFLGQLARLLAPGGVLIIAVPNPDGYWRDFDHVLLDMPPHHATRWRARSFETLATQHGFDLVGIAYEPLRHVHFRQYVDALIAQHLGAVAPPASPRARLLHRLQRLVGFLLSPLAALATALAYESHRRHLPGQTQLVEFRRRA